MATVPTNNSVRIVNPENREYPIAQIIIDGENLRSKGYNDVVQEVDLIRTNMGLSKVKIKLKDELHQYGMSNIFGVDKEIRVYLGYEDESILPVGDFIIKKHGYESHLSGTNINLVAFDKATRLMDDDKSNVYKGKKDSELAIEIAKEANLDPIVQDTEERLETITMSNETYAQFLQRRAKLYGYQFFVDKGKLFFIPPVTQDTDIVMSFGDNSFEGDTVKGGINQVSVNTDILEKGQTAKYEGIDLNKKEKFSVEGEIGDNRPQKELQDTSDFGVVTFDELKGKEAKNIISDVQQEKIKGPMKKAVDALTENRSWLVSGEIKSQGLYDVRPGSTIRVLGLNRFSGKYYVRELRHNFDEGGFQSIIKIARSHYLQSNKDFEPGESSKRQGKEVDTPVTERVSANG